MNVNIGIPAAARHDIIAGLAVLLADTYTLYLKTHNFHWNVTGPMFRTLHQAFEEHYLELALAIDDIAERIRSLGGRAPGSYREFSALTNIPEASSSKMSASEMIHQIVADHETVVRTARSVFPLAETGSDEASADLLTQRLQVHEKNAWMMRAMLE